MNIDLHDEFVKLGVSRKKLTNELLLLLPQIYKDGVFRKFCQSIYEYAAKFGGLTHSQVEKILRLDKYLKNKPNLKSALLDSGVNKVDIVARVATPENEADWADKVRHMSSDSLRAAVNEAKHGSEPLLLTLRMDAETTTMFLEIKEKVAKGLSNKKAIKVILKKLLSGCVINPKRNTQVGNLDEQVAVANPKSLSRHIPTGIKRNMSTVCVYKNCNRLADVFHHRIRFSEHKNHNTVVPLCDIHHAFAHNGLIKNETASPDTWSFQLDGKLGKADKQYRYFRRKSLKIS